MEYFEIKDGEIIKGDLSSLKDGKYKAVKLGDWITTLQHHYYRGWVLPYIQKGLEEMGYFYSTEQIHRWLKDKHLAIREFNEFTGEWINYTKSMANMTKKETIQYLKDVIHDVFDTFGIIIPDHNFINLDEK